MVWTRLSASLMRGGRKQQKYYILQLEDVIGVLADGIAHDFNNLLTALVASGYSNDRVMANFREYGFKGVIRKPFRMEELSQVVQRAVAGG